jgi:hypothetical protein
VFLRREDAEATLAGCLRDEPKWANVLSVATIERDERDVSQNQRERLRALSGPAVCLTGFCRRKRNAALRFRSRRRVRAV